MENLLMQEDIRKLKESNSRLAKDLQVFGITIDDIPEKLSEQFNEYAEVQVCTGLSDMEAIKLQEFYINKKKQQLDHTLAASKLKIEVDDLKKQIEAETKECELLEKFVNKHSNRTEDYDSTNHLLKKKLQSLQQKQENFKSPEGVNIEELVKKIAILKQREGGSNK